MAEPPTSPPSGGPNPPSSTPPTSGSATPDLTGLFNVDSPTSAKPAGQPPTPSAPVMTTEVVPPPPPPAQETVVIPSSNPPAPIQSGPANAFIPGSVPSQPPAPPPAGGSLPRRLLMIFVFLVLAGGLIFAGRYVWGIISGGGEVTLTYWGLWENDAIIRPVIAKFESSHPKIKVQYVKQSPRQYRERLQAAIARDEGPDVFRFHNTWVAMLKNDLALVPATVMTPAQFAGSFYPVAAGDLVAGQNIFGIPLEIDGLGLYYNEDLFAAAGVTPPTTWEEMLTLVPRLTVRSDDQILTSAIALGTTGNVENFSDIVALMMLQNGASLVTPTGTEAEEAFIFYQKFATPSDPVYTWNDTLDNSVNAFATGKVAMILAPSWRAFDIKQINPDLRFKIGPIPQLPGNTVTWASYWVEGVSVKSKNQEAAWEFLTYLTSREAATMLYSEAAKTRLFGEPYARVELAAGVADDPFVGAYVTQAPHAKSFPLASRTFDNGINDRLIKYLEDAVNAVANDGVAPQAALETAAAGFGQVFSSFGLTSATAPQTQ